MVFAPRFSLKGFGIEIEIIRSVLGSLPSVLVTNLILIVLLSVGFVDREKSCLSAVDCKLSVMIMLTKRQKNDKYQFDMKK